MLDKTEKDLCNLFDSWRKCEIEFNGEYKEYNNFYNALKYGDKKTLNFMKHVVTSRLRNSLDHYHNHQHSIMVMIVAHKLYHLYSNGQTSYPLICAGIAHDANHSLGAETDDKNIEVACLVVDQFFTKKSEHNFGMEIKNLIRKTQYPYTSNPTTLEGICLRDADLLYALHSDQKVSRNILDRLCFEFDEKKIRSEQDLLEARKSQYDFFSGATGFKVVFNTELGEAVHKNWLEKRKTEIATAEKKLSGV